MLEELTAERSNGILQRIEYCSPKKGSSNDTLGLYFAYLWQLFRLFK